jgi:hypothetical protein
MEAKEESGVIAKCVNGNCGWEARDASEIVSDDIGNIFCPVCGRAMREVSE